MRSLCFFPTRLRGKNQWEKYFAPGKYIKIIINKNLQATKIREGRRREHRNYQMAIKPGHIGVFWLVKVTSGTWLWSV